MILLSPGHARRRRRAVLHVEVAPSGGTWEFTPGEGALTNLVETCSPAPELDEVTIDLTAGAGGAGKTMRAAVGVGATSATDPGPCAVAAAETVVAFPTNFDGGGPFTVPGSVLYTPTVGKPVVYVLSAQEV